MTANLSQKGKAIAATIITIFSLGLAAYFEGLSLPQKKPIDSSSEPTIPINRKYDLVAFERLKIGMNKTEAFSILNSPGIEIETTDKSAKIIWVNADQSRIEAIFIDGILSNKSHTLLN